MPKGGIFDPFFAKLLTGNFTALFNNFGFLPVSSPKKGSKGGIDDPFFYKLLSSNFTALFNNFGFSCQNCLNIGTGSYLWLLFYPAFK